jgi:hypothetical protein
VLLTYPENPPRPSWAEDPLQANSEAFSYCPVDLLLRSPASGCGTSQSQKGYIVLLLPAFPYKGVELLHQELSQRALLSVLGDQSPKPWKAEHLALGVVGLHQAVSVEECCLLPAGESALEGASRELFTARWRTSHVDDSRKITDAKERARGDTHFGECCLGHGVSGGRPMPAQSVPEGRHRRRS